MTSQTHLVEIDLLHQGQPMPVAGYEPKSHYRILISESGDRPLAQLYPFNLQQPFPTVTIPLKPEDGGVAIAFKPLLDAIYELSGYDFDLDYSQNPIPKWPDNDLTWIDQYLKTQKLRT